MARGGHVHVNDQKIHQEKCEQGMHHCQDRQGNAAGYKIIQIVDKTGGHLQGQQHGGNTQVRQSLQGIVLGPFGFLYRVFMALENAEGIVKNNIKEFFGCGGILFPLPGG